MAILTIISRWLHVLFAALVIGGLFFMRIILPAGLKLLDEPQRQQVFLRCRRIFKMLIHTSILLLILSGTYNSIKAFPLYKSNPPLLHALWGTHILLALIIFAISLWLLMGKEPPAGHLNLALVNVVLLILIVGVGATLKWARERANPPAHAPIAADSR